MFKTTNIESLPDDIIIEILVRVPAQDIYNAAKLVSRRWYKLIRTHDFVRSHLQQSTCGLLIHNWNRNFNRNKPIFVATQKGRIEISNIDYKFTREVLSSCNGLILERGGPDHCDLYITNPATKQHFALPTMKIMTPYIWSAIAYAAAAMKYKVVSSFFCHERNPASRGCVILTVGVDKDWTRRVNIQHLTRAAEGLLDQRPLATQGFVHWAQGYNSDYVLSLNIETEIIKQFPVPPCLRRHDGEPKLMYPYRYLPMGSHLSLVIGRSKFSWDQVWEMNPETGEWTMVASINDSEAREKWTFEGGLSALDCKLWPIGWSKLGEVLVFRVIMPSVYYDNRFYPNELYIAYNVRANEIIDSFELKYYDSNIVHRNSLAWWF
ncbi:F-box protein at5g49610 [Phtheirospermum japonicum]|uniref:F-box protein at5g49610 n=1 Tax=Phtheirospermum japonicum TaxID=374723 RepID=A0A830D7K9_9LAMI|nr:F-box protein at5g49610 [Phtheirospermum japonicum]